MIRNFLKTAIRFYRQQKGFSLLNYLGLTFGLTCAIMTSLYILNIINYDRFHKNYDRIYAVDAYVTYFNGDRFPKEYLSASLKDILMEQSPEIEDITRVAGKTYTFINAEKTFTEQGVFADSNLFEVFSFRLLKKDSRNVLNDPNSIVISERLAIKLFENADCLGKTMIIKEEGVQKPCKISGVFANIPRNSTLQFDFVIPFSKFLTENSWALETGATANETWALLKTNSDRKTVENKIRNQIKNLESTLNQELFLFPLCEQILYSYAGGKRIWKGMQTVFITGSVGLAILLIVCFNYTNLSLALNFKRYREVAIRKASGASQQNIIVQFLGETFLLTFLSLLTSNLFVMALLAGFNKLFNYDIHLNLLDLRLVFIFISISILTGLISGLIPALNLATSNPVDTIKGKIAVTDRTGIFRQGLIVFQFIIPVVLIIGMIVIKAQDKFMRNLNVGVEKDKLIVIDNTSNIQKHLQSFKDDLLAIPGIDAVSFSNCIPTRGAKVTNEVSWEGKDVTEKLHFWCVNSDYDYNKTVSVTITDGRFFSPSFSTDSSAYVINDIAARVMKNQKPVGSSISVDGQKGTVIGVFRDFHALDLAGPYVPTIIRIRTSEEPFILVRFNSDSFRSTADKIRAVYQNYEPEKPINATLFKDLIPYTDLTVSSKLIGLAFIIALFLACMGLVGLASFTSENRIKEIGIRKAHGASSAVLMKLLLSNYTRWLITASIIALPVAFILGNIFLGRFNFRTPFPFPALIVGPLLASAVALLTVFSQTWRAANLNPVEALRSKTD